MRRRENDLVEQGAGVALLDFKRAIYIGLVLLFLQKRPSNAGLDEQSDHQDVS